jgi:signal transduction histidine kinase
MISLLQHVVHSSRYMPHGMCYLWEPDLLWLHVVSDMATGLAYYAIPPALLVLVVRARKQVPDGAAYAARGLPHEWMFLAFGLFIVACGTTHFFAAWNVWNAHYWAAGGVKAVTAAASIATALALPPLIPRALSLVKEARESEVRRVRLEEANRELASLNERLREMDALKTRLFANVSHELRTPLSLILGPADRVLEQAQQGQERPDMEDLRVIRRNALLLRKRVDDLLDLARLDAGEMQLAAAPVDAAHLVRLTGARFASLAQRIPTRLELDVPDQLPALLDPRKYERILDNLLSNAFRFAPEGGTIRLTLERSGDDLLLIVEDDGPGVPAAMRQAVFEPFRQLDRASPRYAGGAGLGLAIVRDFARLHGGEAEVDDSELGGARFVVRVPYREAQGPLTRHEPSETVAADATQRETPARAPTPSEPAPAPAEPASPGRPRALVVEDNPDMLDFVARVLEPEFECDRAANGDEALARLERSRPDLVVTDVMMPALDGRQLLARIRARPELDGLPVVVLTAVAEQELRVDLLRAGASDFLTKPFAPEELVARARNLAGMKRAVDVLRGELRTVGGSVDSMARELAQRRRELETLLEEMEAARDEAHAASRAKSDFMAVISHELRTPLNAITGYVDLLDLEVDGELTEGQRSRLDRIRIGARQLLRIIDDILVYVRSESDAFAVERLPLDLRALVGEVVELLRPEGDAKGIRLETDVEPVTIRSDPERLRRIMTNLVSNAVKFTETGAVRIEARVDEELVLSVQDTGPGIRAEDLDRIFDEFWQVDQSATRAAGGTGLGLSIVRRLADQLGGGIEVESEPGRGSTFTLRVPLE